jgi:hypothetical protein
MHRLKTVLCVLLSLVALYFAYHLALWLVIQRQINSIRRAGFPVTCVELDKWYVQPPAGQNAADVYTEAFARFETWTNKLAESSIPADSTNKSKFYSAPETKRDLLPIVGFAKLPPRTEPLSAETQQLVADYLSDNAEALRLLHQAASMKSCRYPVDLTRGYATSLTHLGRVRQAARLLSLEAVQNAEQQRRQEAVESVTASLAVARSLNQEPMLISCLVHIANQGFSVDSLERVLNTTVLTDGQLAKLAVAIEESESRQALTRAFAGERCCWDGLFQGLRTGKIPLSEVTNPEDNTLWQRLLPLYRVTGLLKVDERTYLDIMEQYVKSTRLPPPDDMTAASVAAGEAKQLPGWCVVSRLAFTELDKVVNKAERCDAKIRDAQTAIAVERFRLANGELPDRLSDLVPSFTSAVPTDPYDGKPLRYKRLAKGYVVYSVGEDREDNGGRETDNKGAGWVAGTDITFTVER